MYLGKLRVRDSSTKTSISIDNLVKTIGTFDTCKFIIIVGLNQKVKFDHQKQNQKVKGAWIED